MVKWSGTRTRTRAGTSIQRPLRAGSRTVIWSGTLTVKRAGTRPGTRTVTRAETRRVGGYSYLKKAGTRLGKEQCNERARTVKGWDHHDPNLSAMMQGEMKRG
jgi:hypothetical protein